MKKQTWYLVAAVIVVIVMICAVWNNLSSQTKPQPADTTLGLTVADIDTRIALYKRHLVDLTAQKEGLNEEIQGTNDILNELEQLRSKVDTVIVKKK